MNPPPTPAPTPQPRPQPNPANYEQDWHAFLHQLFEDYLWDKLTIDVDAEMQQPQGYVGYAGNGLALEILAHNRDDLRLNAKLNSSSEKSSTGYYLGCAAFISAIALGATLYSKKG